MMQLNLLQLEEVYEYRDDRPRFYCDGCHEITAHDKDAITGDHVCCACGYGHRCPKCKASGYRRGLCGDCLPF